MTIEEMLALWKDKYLDRDGTNQLANGLYDKLLQKIDDTAVKKKTVIGDISTVTEPDPKTIYFQKNSEDSSSTTIYMYDDGKWIGMQAIDEDQIFQVDWEETDPTADGYIRNKPNSLPASDVYDWAKQENKPSYTSEEVGAEKRSIELTQEEYDQLEEIEPNVEYYVS